MRHRAYLAHALIPLLLLAPVPAHDPLPSWNEGANKRAILDFVARVTDEKSADFVPPGERIATFDNDGTLWCEQPMYVQAVFGVARAREMVQDDPSLKDKPAFRAILTDDRTALANLGEQELADLVGTTHAGISPEAFRKLAADWLAHAQHPRFRRLYTRCVYQPQLELMNYLREKGFRVFIVTGGGGDFVRSFSEQTYSVPSQSVVGSSMRTRFEARDNRGDLVKVPQIGSIDDGPGKPINIDLHIGLRPILAFGNSDGDLQMLQYTAGGAGARLMLLVHHDDAEREYAYDRVSRVGRLDKALDAARQSGWTLVSMTSDWNTIFP
jgi:phosphoglycolate phosphatase-like HAD superfamily hydrolase